MIWQYGQKVQFIYVDTTQIFKFFNSDQAYKQISNLIRKPIVSTDIYNSIQVV